MGDIYFVRHAESDSRVHDEFLRPLTEKGIQDSALVTNYLKDKIFNTSILVLISEQLIQLKIYLKCLLLM